MHTSHYYLTGWYTFPLPLLFVDDFCQSNVNAVRVLVIFAKVSFQSLIVVFIIVRMWVRASNGLARVTVIAPSCVHASTTPLSSRVTTRLRFVILHSQSRLQVIHAMCKMTLVSIRTCSSQHPIRAQLLHVCVCVCVT